MQAVAEKSVAEAAPPGGFFDDIRRPYKAGQGVVTRRIAHATCVAFALWGAFDL